MKWRILKCDVDLPLGQHALLHVEGQPLLTARLVCFEFQDERHGYFKGLRSVSGGRTIRFLKVHWP